MGEIKFGQVYKFIDDPETGRYAYYYNGKIYDKASRLPDKALPQFSKPLPEIVVEWLAVDDPYLDPLMTIHDSEGTRLQYAYFQKPEDTQPKRHKNKGGRPGKATAKRALVKEIKKLTKQGLSRREVAKSLGVSKDTVQRLSA